MILLSVFAGGGFADQCEADVAGAVSRSGTGQACSAWNARATTVDIALIFIEYGICAMTRLAQVRYAAGSSAVRIDQTTAAVGAGGTVASTVRVCFALIFQLVGARTGGSVDFGIHATGVVVRPLSAGVGGRLCSVTEQAVQAVPGNRARGDDACD